MARREIGKMNGQQFTVFHRMRFKRLVLLFKEKNKQKWSGAKNLNFKKVLIMWPTFLVMASIGLFDACTCHQKLRIDVKSFHELTCEAPEVDGLLVNTLWVSKFSSWWNTMNLIETVRIPFEYHLSMEVCNLLGNQIGMPSKNLPEH